MRASLIGLSTVMSLLFACPSLSASTLNASDSQSTETKSEDSHAKAFFALRIAAMDYAEACSFENARAKLEEDIALNQNFDKDRLPESWLLEKSCISH